MDELFTIMIVDDDAEDIFFLKDAFARQEGVGHFLEFHNGQDAIDYMDNAWAGQEDSHPLPDVVFLDLDMPHKNGYQTLRALKQDASYAQVPVFVISSSILTQVKDLCLAEGCDRFYIKPMTMDEYEQTARDTLAFLSAAE